VGAAEWPEYPAGAVADALEGDVRLRVNQGGRQVAEDMEGGALPE
jgi:hypothetical protein